MSYGETERREDATVEDAHEEMRPGAVDTTSSHGRRRGDDERLNGVMNGRRRHHA